MNGNVYRKKEREGGISWVVANSGSLLTGAVENPQEAVENPQEAVENSE